MWRMETGTAWSAVGPSVPGLGKMTASSMLSFPIGPMTALGWAVTKVSEIICLDHCIRDRERESSQYVFTLGSFCHVH